MTKGKISADTVETSLWSSHMTDCFNTSQDVFELYEGHTKLQSNCIKNRQQNKNITGLDHTAHMQDMKKRRVTHTEDLLMTDSISCHFAHDFPNLKKTRNLIKSLDDANIHHYLSYAILF